MFEKIRKRYLLIYLRNLDRMYTRSAKAKLEAHVAQQISRMAIYDQRCSFIIRRAQNLNRKCRILGISKTEIDDFVKSSALREVLKYSLPNDSTPKRYVKTSAAEARRTSAPRTLDRDTHDQIIRGTVYLLKTILGAAPLLPAAFSTDRYFVHYLFGAAVSIGDLAGMKNEAGFQMQTFSHLAQGVFGEATSVTMLIDQMGDLEMVAESILLGAIGEAKSDLNDVIVLLRASSFDDPNTYDLMLRDAPRLFTRLRLHYKLREQEVAATTVSPAPEEATAAPFSIDPTTHSYDIERDQWVLKEPRD